MVKNTVAHLNTDIEKIPPLDVLGESVVHVQYMFQRVSRKVERPIQPDWHLIQALLDVLSRLRIESHAPAFKQDDIQGFLDRGPSGLGKTISFAVEQAFIEVRDAYLFRSRTIYFLQRLKNGETEGDVMGSREAASMEKRIVRVRRGKGLQIGVGKIEVVDRKRGRTIGRVIFVILREHFFHALGEGRLSRTLWPLQSDEKRCRRRSPVDWKVGIDV
jgi:hypothetical protein